MANLEIQKATKASPATVELVADAVKAVVEEAEENKTPVHKEEVPQKIYVGPNLLGLTKYTVIESEITPHIQSFVKDCPEINKLIVPIEKMAITEARIREKGTLEHRHYNKVQEFKNGKGDK